jgi:hypothetical protein
MVVRWARERGKLAALTETGLEAIPVRNWWTGRLLNETIADQDAMGISYVLVWRNANPAFDRKDHFYVPYPGHRARPISSASIMTPARGSEAICPPCTPIRADRPPRQAS